jgi:hypothetical protein
MRVLRRAIIFVIAGVLLTIVIGNVRQPRSYTTFAAAASRDEVCRAHVDALVSATLRGDAVARDRLLREMPEDCATRLRL